MKQIQIELNSCRFVLNPLNPRPQTLVTQVPPSSEKQNLLSVTKINERNYLYNERR